MKKLLILPLAFLCLLTSFTLSAQDLDEAPVSSFSESARFRNLVYANVSYPSAAEAAGLSGRILVTYTVDPSGRILNLETNFLNEDAEVPASVERIVILGQKRESTTDSPNPSSAKFSLQAESLMVLQRIRQLKPAEYNGAPVTSSRQVVLNFVLE